ncbi:hypothetical protein [Rhodococcus sp. NPDC127528]|uniref:hypothetical protein n=1 Tax=unclassified Rhodococcus (in: high G+C Gram-positive bacteria) TaxID=192944 RepID=UPI00363375F7
MPPTRRTSNTPQPKGRRPKIAGTGSVAGRRGPVAPAGEAKEAPLVEPAEITPAGVASVVVDSDPTAAAVEVAVAETEAVEPEAPRKSINRTSSLRPRGEGGAAVASGVEATGITAADRAAWKPVVVVGAVAVVLAAFAVLAAFEPGAHVSNRAWVDTSETSKVTADAKHAVETLYTYKFDTVDQDFDNARAVLTDDMRAEFDKTAKVTRDAVVQTKTATAAQVTDIGAKLLSEDKAELVASMNVSASNDGQAQGSAEGPLSVTMTKVGDTWLLSGIRDR